MSHPLGTYSFLPWLRQGLANQITSADFDANVKVRAQVRVDLELSGNKVGGGVETVPVSRDVALFGPGDIQGIETRAIVRTEPRDWATNFEPNYLAHIEFYDEDFPWRYTPAAPDSGLSRLRPWIALIVLRDDEFTAGTDARNRPLPYIDLADLSILPPADELWAWAHVHVNKSLAAADDEFRSTDMNAVLPKLQALLNSNPDHAYSRVVCPRKLEENQAYHAFVIPVFETGRRAGLGLDFSGDPSATMSAWDPAARPQGQSFPYYYRWYFRTGLTGDFESLVRLLLPKPPHPKVGQRDMDMQDPGSNVSDVSDNPDLNGILRLGGALRVPEKNFTGEALDELNTYKNWDSVFPRAIQTDLARLINLADDYEALAAEAANANAGIVDPVDPNSPDPDPDDTNPDPIITLPLYGRWHALMQRLLLERDGTPIAQNRNWVHRLNLDPRFRVAAGFGTRVVQDQQEKLMDQAWEQIGKVLEANNRIRRGQFGLQASDVWYQRHMLPLLAVNPQNMLMLMAPLNKRVRVGEFTLHHQYGESLVAQAMTGTALRRIVRPRGRLIRSLQFTSELPANRLLERVNDGEVSIAPPKVTPPGITTVNEVADSVAPQNVPPWVKGILRRYAWAPWIPLLIWLLIAILLLIFLSLATALVVVAVTGAIAFGLYRLLRRWQKELAASDSVREENITPAAVDRLRPSPDFRLSEPGSGFTPSLGGSDSPEAIKFKQALRESFDIIDVSTRAGAPIPRTKLDLGTVSTAGVNLLNPAVTIPKRILSSVLIPSRIRKEIGERFVEAMAYPEFDTPMYEPLKNLSAELFLPNINLIEPNSITLLETNQEFIESYMVGLNHEFARELLWREYPTDQRGSYFRQFWDTRGVLKPPGVTEEDFKEQMRDVPPLHRWPTASALGSHDNREQGLANEEELVLVIRGELLKRYPTAVIYAHRACWQRRDDGTATDRARHPCDRSGSVDNTKERRLVELTDEEEVDPPPSKVLMPLYEAKVDPDIYFFGFDLTAPDAKGGTGANPGDDPGWFFVIKERPGEPRFGLDIAQQPQLNVWNDLSWQDVQPGPAGSNIEISTTPDEFDLVHPTGVNSEKEPQFLEDESIAWSHNINSAELAYILFQAPVLVAVHASEMLKDID